MYPVEPLKPDELERLWRFERRMVRFHAVAMPALLLAAVLVFLYGEVIWFRRSVLVLVFLLVIAATMLQLSEKCPRCGARLRVRSLMRLRDRCHYCGVAFERPPSG
jgi:hypothetical protein